MFTATRSAPKYYRLHPFALKPGHSEPIRIAYLGRGCTIILGAYSEIVKRSRWAAHAVPETADPPILKRCQGAILSHLCTNWGGMIRDGITQT